VAAWTDRHDFNGTVFPDLVNDPEFSQPIVSQAGKFLLQILVITTSSSVALTSSTRALSFILASERESVFMTL